MVVSGSRFWLYQCYAVNIDTNVGQRLAHLPVQETAALLIIGGAFLLSGAIGFYRACIRRVELLQRAS